jgi:hypothetical protein
LPADFAAFLLSYNGGRPSKPYLYSYADDSDEGEEYFDEVRFFSTSDRSAKRKSCLLHSVIEAFGGHVAEDQDEERLSQLMPIASVSRGDGSEAMLALVMSEEREFPQVTQVVYWEHSGVSEDEDDVHATDSFVELLTNLCNV